MEPLLGSRDCSGHLEDKRWPGCCFEELPCWWGSQTRNPIINGVICDMTGVWVRCWEPRKEAHSWGEGHTKLPRGQDLGLLLGRRWVNTGKRHFRKKESGSKNAPQHLFRGVTILIQPGLNLKKAGYLGEARQSTSARIPSLSLDFSPGHLKLNAYQLGSWSSEVFNSVRPGWAESEFLMRSHMTLGLLVHGPRTLSSEALTHQQGAHRGG